MESEYRRCGVNVDVDVDVGVRVTLSAAYALHSEGGELWRTCFLLKKSNWSEVSLNLFVSCFSLRMLMSKLLFE